MCRYQLYLILRNLSYGRFFQFNLLELMRLQDLFSDSLVAPINGHGDGDNGDNGMGGGDGSSMGRGKGSSMDMDNSMGNLDNCNNMVYDRVADSTWYLLLYLQ
ncbi:hypothetical protein PITCH_A1520015 [uncultured Desulfobacterium sp.]|uniref:Uncharacterized protein n=1 Tax=uncultured Desulfobacterium sp. TaxID=201089 RepID=A0A445MTE5_9BACT|nr:hypothetical protein PITCH_A1520015 [uncultured Desulfobacterium sp.]